jgi:hypothetical protein
MEEAAFLLTYMGEAAAVLLTPMDLSSDADSGFPISSVRYRGSTKIVRIRHFAVSDCHSDGGATGL